MRHHDGIPLAFINLDGKGSKQRQGLLRFILPPGSHTPELPSSVLAWAGPGLSLFILGMDLNPDFPPPYSDVEVLCPRTSQWNCIWR